MSGNERIKQFIEPSPDFRGLGYARLKESGVSVWAIIGYLYQAADGDIELVARDYDLPVEAIRAAIEFYNAHTEAIDERLAANSADDTHMFAA